MNKIQEQIQNSVKEFDEKFTIHQSHGKKIKSHLLSSQEKLVECIMEECRKETEKLVWNIFEATKFVKMGSGKKHSGVIDILNPILDSHLVDYIKKLRTLLPEALNKK